MAFEVGKKYKYKYGGENEVFECLAVHRVAGGVWGFMNSDCEYIPKSKQWGSAWSEYKEPRTISRWVNVWEYKGQVRMDGSMYLKEGDALATKETPEWKRLDTIEVKWTEKNV